MEVSLVITDTSSN